MAVQINGTTGITTPKLDALDLELGSKNVVERGSNANGDYVRFADGTQICTTAQPGVNITRGTGNLFSWTYSASFVSVPTAIISPVFPVSSQVKSEFEGVGTADASGFTSNIESNKTGTYQFAAIGRWF